MSTARNPKRIARPLEVSMKHLALVAITLLAVACASTTSRTEEVSFTGGGGIVLRGTLKFPANATGPVPAVVLLHGSERATRKRPIYALDGRVFLQRNLAVLVYDKRGAGESGGDHEHSTFSQLVSDAVAAVAFLRQHSEIDAAKIGVVGASESGWLTPEIAERCGGLAFIINKSGSSISWRDTVAWEVYNELLDDGVDEPSAREQVAILRRIWSYDIKPTPEEKAALENILATWAGRKASRLPSTLREVSDSYVERIAYDPTRFLERLTTPTLYVYGASDVNVPTRASVARLEELAMAGKPIQFHVFENAGHQLGRRYWLPPWYRLLTGYPELLGDFAEAHTRGTESRAPAHSR